MIDFKARMKKLAGAGVNLNPQPKSKPNKYQEDLPELQDIRAIITDRAELTKVLHMVELANDFAKVIKENQDARTAITTRLKEVLTEAGADSAMCDGSRIVIYETKRSTIKRDKLVQAGVSPTVIAKCTDVSTSRAIRVTAPGAEGEDE